MPHCTRPSEPLSSTSRWGWTACSYEIASARLVGKYYPYGQEKPSATTNGTEKFTGYFRDAETGLDYADQRFHNPGTGRFLTPDPYRAMGTGAADPKTPGSWNKYAYAQGDPVNGIDPMGREVCWDDDGEPCYEDPCDDNDFFDSPIDCGGGGGGCGPPPPTPPPPPQPDCSISLYERPAGGKHRPWQHTYIVIDDPLLEQSGYVANELILQAGPSNNFPAFGTLTSQIVPPGQGFGSNKNNASDPNAPGNKEIGSPYTGADACLDIIDLLDAIGNYNDGKQAPYLAVPIPFTGTYNSNSFTYTLLSDIGLSFGSPGFAPGWGPLFSVPNLVP